MEPIPAGSAALTGWQDLALGAGRLATWEIDECGTLTSSGALSYVMGADTAHPEGRLERLVRPVRTMLEDGECGDYEARSPLANGRAVLVRAAVTAGGTAMGVVLDVTGQRDTEQDMVDLIDRYRLLVELSPDGIVVHQDGLIRYSNPAAARYAGTQPDSMVGRSVLDFIDPGDLGETLDRIAALTEPGMVSEPSVAHLLALDGTQRRFESVSVRTSWEGRAAYQVILRDLTDRDRADAAVATQASLVEAVSDAIMAADAQLVVTSWNPAAERMYGWSAQEALGQRIDELVGFTSADVKNESVAIAERGAWSGDVTHHRRDGSLIEVHMSVTLRSDESGEGGLVMICTDVTARRAAEEARAAAEQRYSTVVESLDEGILVVDDSWVIEAANAAAGRILGIAPGVLVGLTMNGRTLIRIFDHHGELLSMDDWPGAASMFAGEPTKNMTVCIERLDGERRWLSASSQPLGDQTGNIVVSFKDITEQRLIQEQVAWAATHDTLTHLPNRSAVLTELSSVLAAETTGNVAVLFCDLDRFKDINDSLGHEAGDAALIEIADRLSRAVRAGDMVGRHAGDEFVVLCRNVTKDQSVELATRLVAAVSAPISLSTPGAHTVRVGISVGVALSTASSDPVGLLRDADVAMYRAKASEAALSIEVFDEDMRDRAQRRLRLREDLRVAVESGALEVHYQPITDAFDTSLRGFEALCRWYHPERGPITPDEFIPLAEESGLISALGAYMLDSSCAQAARWRQEGNDVYVTVNVSARQLTDGSLLGDVTGALERSGLDPQGLWLEVTESALAADRGESAAVLHAVRALGVRIAIDDFGTGYSSLARLRSFPVDALKIDRGFVADLGDDGEGDSAIVEAVIDLAHRLELRVIAEGVETPGQLTALATMGADLAQGWLLGRPVPAERVRFGYGDAAA